MNAPVESAELVRPKKHQVRPDVARAAQLFFTITSLTRTGDLKSVIGDSRLSGKQIRLNEGEEYLCEFFGASSLFERLNALPIAERPADIAVCFLEIVLHRGPFRIVRPDQTCPKLVPANHTSQGIILVARTVIRPTYINPDIIEAFGTFGTLPKSHIVNLEAFLPHNHKVRTRAIGAVVVPR